MGVKRFRWPVTDGESRQAQAYRVGPVGRKQEPPHIARLTCGPAACGLSGCSKNPRQASTTLLWLPRLRLVGDHPFFVVQRAVRIDEWRPSSSMSNFQLDAERVLLLLQWAITGVRTL